MSITFKNVYNIFKWCLLLFVYHILLSFTRLYSLKLCDAAKRNTLPDVTRTGKTEKNSDRGGPGAKCKSKRENDKVEVTSLVCQQRKHDQVGFIPPLEKVKTMNCFWEMNQKNSYSKIITTKILCIKYRSVITCLTVYKITSRGY